MSFDSRQYRQHLYRARQHPSDREREELFVDQRDNFGTVYLSMIPFVVVEYLTEISYQVMPAGLIFPVGYLLFWAFYYTYYQPGFLEERLSDPKRWDLTLVPALTVGIAIWFVKVTVVELGDLLLLRKFFRRRRRSVRGRHPGFARDGRSHVRGAVPFGASVVPAADAGQDPNPLPPDVVAALRVLGLDENATWGDIQHRFRQLAKRYHPDLSPDITSSGSRFMLYQAAYHKLEPFRARFSASIR